jgi:hypothetical protein
VGLLIFFLVVRRLIFLSVFRRFWFLLAMASFLPLPISPPTWFLASSFPFVTSPRAPSCTADADSCPIFPYLQMLNTQNRRHLQSIPLLYLSTQHGRILTPSTTASGNPRSTTQQTPNSRRRTRTRSHHKLEGGMSGAS